MLCSLLSISPSPSPLRIRHPHTHVRASSKPNPNLPLLQWRYHHNPILHRQRTSRTTPSAASSDTDEVPSTDEDLPPDEVPADDEVIKNHAAGSEIVLPPEEVRRRDWINHGWAPWEEILTPEALFARTSLGEGEEVPLQNPEALEAFRLLRASYRRKKLEESGLSEFDWYLQTFRMKVYEDEVPAPLETEWAGPLVLRTVPPRDWPPRGWQVDPADLAFIREAHRLQSRRVDVHADVNSNTDDMALERYKLFVEQYKDWVAANRDRLEDESYKYDQDYYPGRRKRGNDYKEDMLELPFFYPGQICLGKVVTLHLHQGAFVDIGGVHDGWVPIKGNDWFWIRHHIKVGMHVVVEVLAKRDPYRFRFPIELRFVKPNIDHLIFNRFELPPIFHREEDKNPEELWRSAGRPPIPRKRPRERMELQTLMSDHPYVGRLWELHNAEQLILDDEEENPDKYKNKEYVEAMMNADFDEENSVEVTETYYQENLLPKVIVNINPRELDLDAARAERQLLKKLKKEAKVRGKIFKAPKPRRNIEMDEYDFLHWRRSLEEREAFIRDIVCRTAVGLPVEEPGRYIGDHIFKDEYDPARRMYRYDYWGLPKKSKEKELKNMVDLYNQSIVGHRKLWQRMSYDDAIRQKTRLEAQAGSSLKDIEKVPNSFIDEIEKGDDDEDEEHEEYIYALLDEMYDEMEREDGGKNEEDDDEVDDEDDDDGDESGDEKNKDSEDDEKKVEDSGDDEKELDEHGPESEDEKESEVGEASGDESNLGVDSELDDEISED